jgi:hypothetical protein
MSARPAARRGRPPKAATATTDRITLRLTEADKEIIEAIQAKEQAAADKLGLTLSASDALRIALRREGKRLGVAA